MFDIDEQKYFRNRGKKSDIKKYSKETVKKQNEELLQQFQHEREMKRRQGYEVKTQPEVPYTVVVDKMDYKDPEFLLQLKEWERSKLLCEECHFEYGQVFKSLV